MTYFMIVPEADHYRWLGRKSDIEGLTLARVKHASVADSWKPISVEWLPETVNRALCDFPIFTPVVRCMSNRAAEVLQKYLSNSIELLPLHGATGYIGFHCTKWLDAADMTGIDQERTSIHSTMFVPKLKRKVVSSHHIFGDHQMVSKIFVSSDVAHEIRKSKLTGVEFHEVELT